MNCEDCTQAAQGPWHGYRKDCQGCTARALSRSHAFHESRQAGRLTKEYRAALDKAGVTHAQVCEADQLTKETR